jgi:hypothetical protein
MKRVRRECSATIRYIHEELGENLESRRHRSIRNHLVICADCSAYLESLRLIVSLYRSDPIPALSDQMKKALHELVLTTGR